MSAEPKAAPPSLPQQSGLGRLLDELAATPLPRGRHNLSREQVRAAQRIRILAAMVKAVAEHGYVAVSVAEVLSRAGISRETFYEQFSNKQECFLAAYEETVSRTIEIMLEAINFKPDAPPVQRLRDVLVAYLDVMQSEPEVAKTFMLEVYAAGPEALLRRVEVTHSFGELVYNVLSEDKNFQAYTDPSFLAHSFAGAVSAAVTAHLAKGKGATIAELEQPILALLDDLLRKRAA